MTTGDYIKDSSVPFLSDDDRNELEVGSAIRPEVIAAQEFVTVQDKRDLPRYGFTARNGAVPCLLVPRHTIDGETVYTVKPRTKEGGAKYLNAKGAGLVINCNPLALPEVLSGNGDLWITEGVKKSCAAVSHGLVCIDIGGVDCWRSKDGTPLPDWYKIPFKGRRVKLTFDHDEKPISRLNVHFAMLKLSKFLKSLGAEVWFVYLPLGKNGEKCGLDDFFVSGGTVMQLTELAEPHLRALHPDGIETNDRQLAAMGEDAIGALAVKNDPPRLFIRSGSLSRIQCDEHEKPTIVPLCRDAIQGELARAAEWISTSEKRGAVSVAPPPAVCSYILHDPEYPDALPPLQGIVSAPTFASDGTLHDTPGYHPSTRLYYHPVDMRPIPDSSPTVENIAVAKRLLIDDLFPDFPFADDASRAHALGFLILPFVREMIDGPTPLHLYDAPKAGTGKTLIVELSAGVFGNISTQVVPPDDSEMRKVLTTHIAAGGSHLIFDNARSLNFPSLDNALTCSQWEDRILGSSTKTGGAVRLCWAVTANNLKASDDSTRRSVLIRLDAGVENPDERKEFRHADIRSWAKENRPSLIGAVITLVRAWIDAGRPNYSGANTMGSFESWVRVIGGILETVGIDGFLDNRQELRQRADSDSGAWRGFVSAWYEAYGERPTTSGELLPLAEEWLAESLGDKESNRGVRFGKLLRTKIDGIFAGYKIVRKGTSTTGISKGAVLYALLPTSKTGEGGEDGEGVSANAQGVFLELHNKNKNTTRGTAETPSPSSPPSPILEEMDDPFGDVDYDNAVTQKRSDAEEERESKNRCAAFQH